MPQPRRRTRFTQKPKLRGLVAKISFADNLDRHRTPQIDIERLVGHTHSTTTQLDRSASLIQHHLVVLKSPSLQPTVSLVSASCCTGLGSPAGSPVSVFTGSVFRRRV